MPKRDRIVIGASAGGVEALQKLVAQFPAGFPAAVFVVLHIPSRTHSLLPRILERACKLPAVHAEDGAAIEHGIVYIAPPNHHLVVERDHVHLSMGPREQHHRPSINVTMRTAAMAYGSRVVGVVLSGELDDGTAGLWEIKRRDGVAVVQNPEEADYPSMPLSALREVEVDYTVRLAEMGDLLGRLAAGKEEVRKTTEATEMEPVLTDVTCPDCRGTIWAVQQGSGVEFRCRVGHKFSPKTMLAVHYAAQEKALYEAVVMLEEGAALTKRLTNQFDRAFGERLREEAVERERQAHSLRQVLRDLHAFSLD